MRDLKADRARWLVLDKEFERLRHLVRERSSEIRSKFLQAAKGRGPAPTDDDLIGLAMLEDQLDAAKAAGDAFLKEVFG